MSGTEPRPPGASAAALVAILAASGLAEDEIAAVAGMLPALADWRAPEPAAAGLAGPNLEDAYLLAVAEHPAGAPARTHT